MDIDQIITGNVDDLIGHPVSDNELVTYGIWWNSIIGINGGFYKFKSGSLDYVWNDFALNPEYWQMYYFRNKDVHFKYYGEQNYVNMKLHEKNMKVTTTPPEWLCKYTSNKNEMVSLHKEYTRRFNTEYMILDKPNDMIKVVHFTGPGKTIHDHNEQFIKDYWNDTF